LFHASIVWFSRLPLRHLDAGVDNLRLLSSPERGPCRATLVKANRLFRAQWHKRAFTSARVKGGRLPVAQQDRTVADNSAACLRPRHGPDGHYGDNYSKAILQLGAAYPGLVGGNRDVYVYFDNDRKSAAPTDAVTNLLRANDRVPRGTTKQDRRPAPLEG